MITEGLESLVHWIKVQISLSVAELRMPLHLLVLVLGGTRGLAVHLMSLQERLLLVISQNA